MVGQQRIVAPNDIRFTQDSISEVFGDHGQQNFEKESIEETFKMLLYGDVTVNSIRPMAVVQKDGRLWVVSGNRRLYIYRKLQEFRRISEVTVKVVPINMERFQKMFSTKNQGVSVIIRQDRLHLHGDKMEDRLRKIYNQWIRHGSPTDGFPVQRTMSYQDNYFASTPRTPVETRRSSQHVLNGRPYTSPPPRTTYAPPPSPPPPSNAKDDSWCAIL